MYDITLAFLAISNVDEADLVAEEISKITKEKINAVVTLFLINPSAWGQQINLMLTSVDKLDLVVTSTAFDYNAQVSSG